MSGPFGSSLWMGSSSSSPVTNSLIFTRASSQLINRVFGTATDNKIKTLSFWFKRASTGTVQTLFSSYQGSGGQDMAYFDASNVLQVNGVNGGSGGPTATISDTSSWHHFCYNIDTTQATASNRAKVWVDGTLYTSGWTYPALNATNCRLMNGFDTPFGQDDFVSGNYFDGKLADYYYVDGTAYDYTNFYNAGVPLAPVLTYGSQGFHLTFSDASSTTTLGADSSVNGNNFTLTNMTTSNSSTDHP